MTEAKTIEFNLTAFNDVLYKLKNNPEAQLIAEQAFDQTHRFCNAHLHLDGKDIAATKSDVVAMLMNDMSDEILKLDCLNEK